MSHSSFFHFRDPFLFSENLIPNLFRHCVYMYVHRGQKCHRNVYCKFHAFPNPKSYFLSIFTYFNQWFMFLFPPIQIVFFRISSLQIAMTILVLFFTISSHEFSINCSFIVRLGIPADEFLSGGGCHPHRFQNLWRPRVSNLPLVEES